MAQLGSSRRAGLYSAAHAASAPPWPSRASAAVVEELRVGVAGTAA